jgi:hypothetical protein
MFSFKFGNFLSQRKKGIGNIILKKFHNCAKFSQQKIMSVPNFTPKNSLLFPSFLIGMAPPPPLPQKNYISKLSGEGKAAPGQWA